MKIRIKANVKAPKGRGGDCPLVFCFDEATGALVLEKEGKCPSGMVKKINAAIRSRGIILPREDD